MPIFLQIAIAVAAAAVLFGVIWTVYGALRTPVRCGQGTGVHTVVSVRGSAEGLEQTLRGLVWLQQNGAVVGQIAIVDCGLDEEGRVLSRLAVKKHGNIVICRAEDLESWIAEAP